ncbi:hypothetical protein B296_00009495 [Ensete ventricosum]|uniref:Uncharacterized protein n=1 Tax=Ensete ventricosum TaxID=4639 RepID=A0A427ARR8_ENSVE|nr:hypothetical protein B296_00009495 [Ensete ventricosum]
MVSCHLNWVNAFWSFNLHRLADIGVLLGLSSIKFAHQFFFNLVKAKLLDFARLLEVVLHASSWLLVFARSLLILPKHPKCKVPWPLPFSLVLVLGVCLYILHLLRPFHDQRSPSMRARDITPRKLRLYSTMALPSLWHYYPLPRICIYFFAIGISASAAL